jgi:hypothetical protein
MITTVNIWENKKVLIFFLLCLASCALTYAWNKYLIYDDLYYDFFSDQMSIERITGFLSKAETLQWLSYCAIPIMYSLKILLLSIIILAGLLIYNFTIPFKKVLTVIIISEFIFVIAFLIRLLWFSLIDVNYTLADLQSFYPLSLINFFDYSELQKWIIYPLQTVNIFELFYWLLLAAGLQQVSNYSFSEMLKAVLTSYVPALLLWVVSIMFLTISYSS